MSAIDLVQSLEDSILNEKNRITKQDMSEALVKTSQGMSEHERNELFAAALERGWEAPAKNDFYYITDGHGFIFDGSKTAGFYKPEDQGVAKWADPVDALKMARMVNTDKEVNGSEHPLQVNRFDMTTGNSEKIADAGMNKTELNASWKKVFGEKLADSVHKELKAFDSNGNAEYQVKVSTEKEAELPPKHSKESEEAVYRVNVSEGKEQNNTDGSTKQAENKTSKTNEADYLVKVDSVEIPAKTLKSAMDEFLQQSAKNPAAKIEVINVKTGQQVAIKSPDMAPVFFNKDAKLLAETALKANPELLKKLTENIKEESLLDHLKKSKTLHEAKHEFADAIDFYKLMSGAGLITGSVKMANDAKHIYQNMKSVDAKQKNDKGLSLN